MGVVRVGDFFGRDALGLERDGSVIVEFTGTVATSTILAEDVSTAFEEGDVVIRVLPNPRFGRYIVNDARVFVDLLGQAAR